MERDPDLPPYVVIAGAGTFGIQAGRYFVAGGLVPLFVDLQEPVREPLEAAFGEVAVIALSRDGGDGGDRSVHAPRQPTVLVGDILDVLLEFTTLARAPTYLVPAVPFHLLGKVCHQLFETRGHPAASEATRLSRLAECLTGKDDYCVSLQAGQGLLVASYAPAGKICPETCPGQLDYCAHRGQVTRAPLFENARACARTRYATTWIVESEQLSAGVGGIPWSTFQAGLERLRAFTRQPPGDGSFLVGTACNCHGVFNSFTSRA